MNTKTKCFYLSHFRSYNALSYSKAVKPADGKESILELRELGDGGSLLGVDRENVTGRVEEPVAGMLRISRHELVSGESHGRLKVESNGITGLRGEAPEESVSLVGPDEAVVLVVLDRRLCKGQNRGWILTPDECSHLLPITAAGFL